MSANPYATPDSDLSAATPENPSRDYGGINRITYFGLVVVMTIVNSFLTLRMALDGGSSFLLVTAVFTILSFVAAYYRLKNIGDSGWLSLLLIVPVANIIIGIRCLAYQEAYADTQKLDTTGKVIIGVFVGVIVLGILAAIMIPNLT